MLLWLVLVGLLCVALVGCVALGQVAFVLVLDPLDAFEYAPVLALCLTVHEDTRYSRDGLFAPRRSLVEIQDATVQR